MELDPTTTQRTLTWTARVLSALKLDGPLLTGIGLIASVSLIILYSSSGTKWSVVGNQASKFALAIVVMLIVAQIPPRLLRLVAPWLYGVGLLLLLAVMLVGDISLGAQRWLNLGFVRFQPSEIMKIAVPLFCAWYVHDRPLPPSFLNVIVLALIIVIPVGLIAEQPDLGTALLVGAAGAMALLLSGLQKRYIFGVISALIPTAWVAWSYLLHDYQRQRVLTFMDPSNDPLGSGYHIIQSQIAIGSGGILGKGYLNGSQAQLAYLPESSTDFIFSVIGEEWGLLGLIVVLLLYLFIISRCLFLATSAQDTFARTIAGSLALTFAVYVFVNTGMVTGLLPVVGVPLPLISYGGTSMVTLMAGFGILMSVSGKRRLVGH